MLPGPQAGYALFFISQTGRVGVFWFVWVFLPKVRNRIRLEAKLGFFRKG